ncbi:ATP-binding protein [Kaarinaea lacus]
MNAPKFTMLLRRLSDSFIPVAAMALFMVMSMALLSAATENSSQFGRMHLVLVVINVLGLIALVGLIGANLIKLLRQYRRNVTGSRLTMRMVVIFVILSVAPVSLVYYFSLGFLQRGIDSWFDVRMGQAMEDSLKLSRAALDLHKRELLKRTRTMADTLMDVPNELALMNLNDLRASNGANELTLLTLSGIVINSSSEDASAIIPNRPDESTMLQVKENESFADVAPVGELGLHIRVAVGVSSSDTDIEPRILYALYPMAERIGELADAVEVAYAQYKKLVFLREPLKNSFVLTLSLVLLVSILTAVWAAFFSAERLVSPIRILSMGTKAVAAGNYDKKFPATTNDELGSLVRSFADMTQKLATARDSAAKSQKQVERERTYLRAVLGRLSSGVLTLDHGQKLRVANGAASQILGADLENLLGGHLQEIVVNTPQLSEFVHVLTKNLSSKEKEWREEVIVKNKGDRKTLMCQGALLPSVKGLKPGYVVVFDDVSNLVKAQRDAAWGEVARRLAHEIKNPLTPIQLSAERLRRKYLDKMPAEEAELLDRSTQTIVEQVESMKEMVKAFSEYARVPQIDLQPLHLDALVSGVLELYQAEETGAQVLTDFEGDIPLIEADPGRMRQLLHNLLKNAIESTHNISGAKITITIRTLYDSKPAMLELRVDDNGPGIPENLFENLFEPNATTKSKGGGLGLAVVKRIVEEHSGLLLAENKPQGGASLAVRLPIFNSEAEDQDNLLAQAK